MTTLNSAWARRRLAPARIFIVAALAGAALAGCESSSGVLPGADGSAPNAAIAPPAGQPASTQLAKIQIAPVIGSPENVARDLALQLSASIEKRNITVAKSADASGEYVLRGYIVAAREKTGGSKVSYIWDITDQQGRRAHRITGEELVAGGAGKDPWSSVTAQTVQAIADRTAAQIATWVSSSASVPVAGAAVAGSTQTAAAAPAPAQQIAAAAPQPAPLTTAAVTPPPATGSIDATGSYTTIVPTITGAPGDGGTSLTAAIQRELTRNGVTLATSSGAATYKVEGKVAMGLAKDGKQPIQIDWNVIDPKGKKLGTVSQKNEVPQGTLDGAWGKTADLAAAAAAQGILKLLPRKTASN